MALSPDTTDTTRVPSPELKEKHQHSPKSSDATSNNAFPPSTPTAGKAVTGHDAAAAEALIAGEKPLMTDDEIRLAQMPTGLRLYLIMLGLML